MALTTDSKIGDLLSDEKAKAILDKHLSGLSYAQIAMAKLMTLKMLAPVSGGKITSDILKAIEEDLNKL